MNERQRLAPRLHRLHARAAIRTAVRAWFEEQDFLEVETPARVPSPGQEVHLDAIAASDGRFLITSPEYHMKRLVAAGLPRIVQMGRCWRGGETGSHHQPEFTMIEWYRAGAALDDIARDCEAILQVAARAVSRAGEGEVPSPDAKLATKLAAPFERVTVRQVLQRYAGIDLHGDETASELRAAAASAGCHVAADASWDDVFFQIFLDKVEPHLGVGQPTFVFDWPLPLGALARRKVEDSRLVERFELYAGGLELANAFGELTDPAEQRARFVAEADHRRRLGKTVYPVDEKLLLALAHMPPTCGVALGFDRLVMLVTGAEAIRDVVAFADNEI